MFYRHHMMAKHNNSVAAIEGEPSVILIHSIPCVNGGMATTSMESRRAEGSIPAEEGAVLWLWSKDCSGCNKGANKIAEASTANKSELLARSIVVLLALVDRQSSFVEGVLGYEGGLERRSDGELPSA